VGHVALKRRVTYIVVVEKRERKRPLGIPWRRCGDNIKTDLQEKGRGALTGLIRFRIVARGGNLYTR